MASGIDEDESDRCHVKELRVIGLSLRRLRLRLGLGESLGCGVLLLPLLSARADDDEPGRGSGCIPLARARRSSRFMGWVYGKGARRNEQLTNSTAALTYCHQPFGRRLPTRG